MIKTRLMSAAVLCCAAVAALPANASGARATSVEWDRPIPGFGFLYSGEGAERNDVTLVNAESAAPGLAASGPDAIAVLDAGPGVTVRAVGCVPLSLGAVCSSALFERDPGAASVGAAPWRSIGVTLGDGADRLRIRGFESDVALEVSGGAGDDRIDVSNENAEAVSCGPGDDVVIADPHDFTYGDCEQVEVRDCAPIVIGCEVEDLLPSGLAVRR